MSILQKKFYQEFKREQVVSSELFNEINRHNFKELLNKGAIGYILNNDIDDDERFEDWELTEKQIKEVQDAVVDYRFILETLSTKTKFTYSEIIEIESKLRRVNILNNYYESSRLSIVHCLDGFILLSNRNYSDFNYDLLRLIGRLSIPLKTKKSKDIENEKLEDKIYEFDIFENFVFLQNYLFNFRNNNNLYTILNNVSYLDDYNQNHINYQLNVPINNHSDNNTAIFKTDFGNFINLTFENGECLITLTDKRFKLFRSNSNFTYCKELLSYFYQKSTPFYCNMDLSRFPKLDNPEQLIIDFTNIKNYKFDKLAALPIKPMYIQVINGIFVELMNPSSRGYLHSLNSLASSLNDLFKSLTIPEYYQLINYMISLKKTIKLKIENNDLVLLKYPDKACSTAKVGDIFTVTKLYKLSGKIIVEVIDDKNNIYCLNYNNLVIKEKNVEKDSKNTNASSFSFAFENENEAGIPQVRRANQRAFIDPPGIHNINANDFRIERAVNEAFQNPINEAIGEAEIEPEENRWEDL